MNNAGVRWDGLTELEAFLSETPGALARVGTGIVDGAAQTAAAYIKGVYTAHKVTGNLAKGVRVRAGSGDRASRPVRVLRSGAHHAHLFEFGTQVRHHKKFGDTFRPAPAHPTFIPTVTTARRQMRARLVALVAAAGFTVSGA